jgi:hypothetical protein
MENSKTDELMGEIIELIDGVKTDWDKIRNKHNATAGRRIRKALDEVAKLKVDLRKAMLKEGR